MLPLFIFLHPSKTGVMGVCCAPVWVHDFCRHIEDGVTIIVKGGQIFNLRARAHGREWVKRNEGSDVIVF